MSIPKIYALGHKYTEGIFDGPVVIQEKIDGSQFSFGVTDGKLWCRSKSTELNLAAPGMFFSAVETAYRLFTEGKLSVGVTYQCEYLAKPKHNVLAYSRIPAGNLVLFDVLCEIGYLCPARVQGVALEFGLEPVPLLHLGEVSIDNRDNWIQQLLQHDSVLGGQKIEGIVIKNYSRIHHENQEHIQTAKVVSLAFKERHASSPRNPKACGDGVQAIISALRTEARWIKAVGHLRDEGKLVNGPEDIGPLMKELWRDLWEEEADWIQQQLQVAFEKDITKGVQAGFPDWYKKVLTSGGFSVFQAAQAENNRLAERIRVIADETADGPTAEQCDYILGKQHYNDHH